MISYWFIFIIIFHIAYLYAYLFQVHCVGALDVSTIINYVQHCSTMFIFITSRDHFRLRLEMAIDDLYMQSSADIFLFWGQCWRESSSSCRCRRSARGDTRKAGLCWAGYLTYPKHSQLIHNYPKFTQIHYKMVLLVTTSGKTLAGTYRMVNYWFLLFVDFSCQFRAGIGLEDLGKADESSSWLFHIISY